MLGCADGAGERVVGRSVRGSISVRSGCCGRDPAHGDRDGRHGVQPPADPGEIGSWRSSPARHRAPVPLANGADEDVRASSAGGSGDHGPSQRRSPRIDRALNLPLGVARNARHASAGLEAFRRRGCPRRAWCPRSARGSSRTRFPRGRRVVGERREAAVVGGAELGSRGGTSRPPGSGPGPRPATPRAGRSGR